MALIITKREEEAEAERGREIQEMSRTKMRKDFDMIDKNICFIGRCDLHDRRKHRENNHSYLPDGRVPRKRKTEI